MITLSIESIRQFAARRPAGYMEDVLSRGTPLKDEGGNVLAVALSQEVYDSLVQKYRSPTPPSFLQKAKNFTKAAVQHVASGMPMASEEEIERRFAICRGCEFLKDNACTKCGCPVQREKKFISKLAWADQSCPVGKWGNGK